MKNKLTKCNHEKVLSDYAFTLIELLAVIVILAVIALIATPTITGIIKDSKKSSLESETKMIVSTINNYCMAQKTLGKSCGTRIDDYDGIIDKNDLVLSNAEIENDKVKSLVAKRECIKVKVIFDSDNNNYIYNTTEGCAVYAFGDPTGSNTENYESLNKSVFVQLDGEDKSLCIIMNGSMECLKPGVENFASEKEHLITMFGSSNCSSGSDYYYCSFNGGMFCSVYFDGRVQCRDNDTTTTAFCKIESDGTISCY